MNEYGSLNWTNILKTCSTNLEDVRLTFCCHTVYSYEYLNALSTHRLTCKLTRKCVLNSCFLKLIGSLIRWLHLWLNFHSLFKCLNYLDTIDVFFIYTSLVKDKRMFFVNDYFFSIFHIIFLVFGVSLNKSVFIDLPTKVACNTRSGLMCGAHTFTYKIIASTNVTLPSVSINLISFLKRGIPYGCNPVDQASPI